MRAEKDSREQALWVIALKSALEATGELGAEAGRYLRDHRICIGVRPQSAGARWTIDRRIEIHPQYARDLVISPYAMSLVMHEVRHLQQGPLTALSVYGELDAWHVQFAFLQELSVSTPGSSTQRELVHLLLELPLGWDRHTLSIARGIMREYAGRSYRVDLLPLYPIHHELTYAVTRRPPGQI